MSYTEYSSNPNSYNVQQQRSYPPPPPPPQYANPFVQGNPAYPGAPTPFMQQPVQGNGKAVAGLVLGLISMIAWLLPILGLPISIIGLVLASKARNSLFNRGMANTGYVLCLIALILSLLNAFAGVLLAIH